MDAAIGPEKTSRIIARYALERAEVILANMAQKNTGFWASLFSPSRWAIDGNYILDTTSYQR